MTITTLRRAGPPAAIPASAVAFHDPMLAAIDRHRAAYLKQMRSGAVYGAFPDNTPEHIRALRVWNRDSNASNKASLELLDLVPGATFTGLIALLGYVHEFNSGSLFMPEDKEYGNSSPMFWPEIDKIEYDDGHGGASFAWALIANIRKALQSHVGKVVVS